MKKKIYPRVTSHLPVVVTTEDNIRLKAVALDTSQYGFSFQCSTIQRNSLTPGGCFIPNGRPVELEAILDLPFADQSIQIRARCHISFSRRIANDKCEIGIRFEEFEGEGYKYLLNFIETKSVSASLPRKLPNALPSSPVQLFV